jgi:uncharacterized protein with HEPN domain
MRDKLGEPVRNSHILEAIPYIELFTKEKTEEDLVSQAMMLFAVIKQLEIIGEAANHISQESKDRMSDIEWWKIKGFRNISVHEYFGINPRILWSIVQNDIPVLKAALLKYKDTAF